MQEADHKLPKRAVLQGRFADVSSRRVAAPSVSDKPVIVCFASSFGNAF
jgi:hypothetical protein